MTIREQHPESNREIRSGARRSDGIALRGARSNRRGPVDRKVSKSQQKTQPGSQNPRIVESLPALRPDLTAKPVERKSRVSIFSVEGLDLSCARIRAILALECEVAILQNQRNHRFEINNRPL